MFRDDVLSQALPEGFFVKEGVGLILAVSKIRINDCHEHILRCPKVFDCRVVLRRRLERRARRPGATDGLWTPGRSWQSCRYSTQVSITAINQCNEASLNPKKLFSIAIRYS